VSKDSSVTVMLSGAGGGVIDPMLFCSSIHDATRFPTIGYPGWRRYVEKGFSAKTLVEELSTQIALRVPEGPIRIIGISIGGHLGYAVALYLQASGREIGGFCAIDTLTATSSAPMTGWKTRAIKTGVALLRDRRLGDFGRFLRSRLWRASLRLSGQCLVGLVNRLAPSGRLPWILRIDSLFEEELSMRLLIREVAPWLASLDDDPTPLRAPALLLRTASTGDADAIWRRRCPWIKVLRIAGDHSTFFEPEKAASLREAFLVGASDWS
jgi:thioesterase domain-containing protein